MKLYHWLAIAAAIFAAFRIGACNKEVIPEPVTDPFVKEIQKKEDHILILEKQLDSLRKIPHDTVYKTLYIYANSALFLPAGPSIRKWDSINTRFKFPLDQR